MSPKSTKWCAHPIQHKNCTKTGCKTTHAKEKRVIRKKLSKFMQVQYRRIIGGSKTIIKEGEFLCTSCYNLENNKMNKKYGVSKAAQDSVGENVNKIDSNTGSFSLNSDEDSSDENSELSLHLSRSSSLMEQTCLQMESINVLNTIFELLQIKPLTDRYVFY